MNVSCKCGGRFRRSDIVRVDTVKYGTLYKDTDPLIAHWRCDKCGSERRQKKRQPRTLIETYNAKRNAP